MIGNPESQLKAEEARGKEIMQKVKEDAKNRKTYDPMTLGRDQGDGDTLFDPLLR